MKISLKKISIGFFGLACVYFLLMIPGPSGSNHITRAVHTPFAWNSDTLWDKLENDFKQARQYSPGQLDSIVTILKQEAGKSFSSAEKIHAVPADSILTLLEQQFFSLTPFIAVKRDELPWYLEHYNRVRNYVKSCSEHWDMENPASRVALYRLIYGMRAAVEEALLQAVKADYAPALKVKDVASQTPAAKIFGIEVHSGDLLVSRGGAEVSALISRGNDYPGNFSHVALLYVDDKTGEPYLVEAHIEKGVAISSVSQYEADAKLRFMVIRPQVIKADPMLPHKAARYAYQEAQKRHIPYDFKMNFHDSTAMFCSEVASFAYAKQGLKIWQPVSTISSQGTVNWLHGFGVEHFVTQMPSDLEYDPQLAVVAEWRNPETLFKDHIDNAVMDAMLQQANKGRQIGYNNWQLPVARVLKAYSALLNLFGKPSIIPEGMDAVTALKNQRFVQLNKRIRNRTQEMAGRFIRDNGYRPPYRQLVHLAELAADEN